MSFLEQQFLGNSLLQWLGALLVLVLGTFVLRGAKQITVRRLGSWARRTETSLDDLFIRLVKHTHMVVLFLVALAAATLVVSLPGGWNDWLRTVTVLALLIQAGIWASEVLFYGIQRMLDHPVAEGEEPPDPAAQTLFRLLGRLVIWAVVVLLCLENMGIDITALVAGLGVGGIAVALAVQNILGDLFASFSILLDKPFVAGDFIVLGDYMGTVERVGIKTTRVRSLGGEQLVFSNADLLQSRIRNYKRMRERRALFGFGVVYQTPADVLEQIPGLVRGIIESKPKTRCDRVHFKSFGASSLDFEVVYYMLSTDYNEFMDTQQAINLDMVRTFDERGIEFAYPTQTLFHVGVDGPPPSGRGPAARTKAGNGADRKSPPA